MPFTSEKTFITLSWWDFLIDHFVSHILLLSAERTAERARGLSCAGFSGSLLGSVDEGEVPDADLYRLRLFLSPNFPPGCFSPTSSHPRLTSCLFLHITVLISSLFSLSGFVIRAVL